MKRMILFLLSISAVVLLCSCGESEYTPETETGEYISTVPPADNGAACIANPMTEITADDLCYEMQIKNICIDGIQSIYKLDGDIIIYDIDVLQNKKSYNLRLAVADDMTDKDISGVYLNGRIRSAIYDSADENTPSFSVSGDDQYFKAYTEWNGYFFSVSSNDVSSLEEMNEAAVNFAKLLIAKDNLN